MRFFVQSCSSCQDFNWQTASRGPSAYFNSAVLFIRTVSQKPMQLWSPKLTKKCYPMSDGNPLILGSKGLRSRSPVTTLPLAVYVSHAGFSLLQWPAAQAMLATWRRQCACVSGSAECGQSVGCAESPDWSNVWRTCRSDRAERVPGRPVWSPANTAHQRLSHRRPVAQLAAQRLRQVLPFNHDLLFLLRFHPLRY